MPKVATVYEMAWQKWKRFSAKTPGLRNGVKQNPVLTELKKQQSNLMILTKIHDHNDNNMGKKMVWLAYGHHCCWSWEVHVDLVDQQNRYRGTSRALSGATRCKQRAVAARGRTGQAVFG